MQPIATPDEHGSPTRWMVAVLLLGLAVAYALPAPLLDGDSCINAALARDMARGDGNTWLAPHWAQGGQWRHYYEHAPGSYWVSAAVMRLGVPAHRAVHMAHTLWIVLAAWGVLTLVGTHRRDAAIYAGAIALLLHLQPLKYVQRVSIEFPLAATTAWALVATLRLRDGWRWALLGAVALAGGFLVRGIFGGVALGLVGLCLFFPSVRPPWTRWLALVGGAALLVLVFDRAHASVSGAGWWWSYFHRQIASSFVEGGTQHTVADRQFGYFAARLVGYAMPFLLLVLWRFARGPRRPAGPALTWILVIGVLATWLAASLTRRPASRYLFAAWPLLATLFACALPAALPRRITRLLPWGLLLLVPALLAAKHLTRGEADWQAAATTLQQLREADDAPAIVRGPFDPQDSRDKAFLRWHLDARAIGGTPSYAAWWIVRREEEIPANAVVRARLPFGVLLSPKPGS